MQALNGDRIVRYEIQGSGHRPVVLLPALGASSAVWERQFPVMEGYTIVTCEISGHFPSGTEPASLADFASDVRAVLDAVGLQAVSVVGLSMGGMVAQELALCFPARVSALVLISTASEYPEPARDAMRDRANSVEESGMAGVVESIVTRWFTSEFAKSHEDEVYSIRRDLLGADPRQYARAARAVAEVATTGRLSSIVAPTLVIHGERDPSISLGAARTLAAGIPGATLATVNAAHLCNVEAGETVNELLVRFLDSLRLSRDDEDTTLMAPW